MSGRILVVDDIATNRMILRTKLAAAYFEVIQAENGTEAIARTAEFAPDLILLDVMMPDINGFEVCRKLKSDPKTAHIPVIMLTALYDHGDRVRGLECGADDFLSKPINDLALFARVRNLLRSKFMFDELRLRDQTTRELGLGESGQLLVENANGRVVLVPCDASTGQQWQQAIKPRMQVDLSVICDENKVTALEGDQLPDVFVVHSRIGDFGDGLRLVSHLRSRPNSRHAAVILVVPEGDMTRAAKGLDLGATDYIFDPFDASELIVRLQSQIRNKRMSDRLRSNVDDSLRLAVMDPLTGLYNRRYVKQHLGKITGRSRETGKEFALMVMDIDNFKRVNDNYGHAAGDQVLKEFARRLQENLRGVDLVSRIGGEEFLIAMPDTTMEQAEKASERLRRVIEQDLFHFSSAPNGLRITASIGVTLGNPEAPDVDQLIQQADRALYASKSEGRNMVTMFKPAA